MSGINIDTLTLKILAVLFVAACCVGVASWLLALLEGIAVLRLQDWAFRIGPVATVYETGVECPIGLSVVSAAETAHVKYRVLEGRRCLFRRKFALFEFRWNTPLELKGVISWADGKLTTSARYLLGVTLFFLAWLTGWTIGGLMFVIKGQIIGLAFIGLGWLVGLGMMAHSRSLELKRFGKYAAEVQAALGECFPSMGVV
jgi:hypothetical protein